MPAQETKSEAVDYSHYRGQANQLLKLMEENQAVVAAWDREGGALFKDAIRNLREVVENINLLDPAELDEKSTLKVGECHWHAIVNLVKYSYRRDSIKYENAEELQDRVNAELTKNPDAIVPARLPGLNPNGGEHLHIFSMKDKLVELYAELSSSLPRFFRPFEVLTRRIESSPDLQEENMNFDIDALDQEEASEFERCDWDTETAVSTSLAIGSGRTNSTPSLRTVWSARTATQSIDKTVNSMSRYSTRESLSRSSGLDEASG